MKLFLELSVAFYLLCVAFTADIALHKRSADANHIFFFSCESMSPFPRDSPPQAVPSPFDLIASKNKASPGDIINVLAVGKHGNIKFKRLYMQARVVNAGVVALGKFVPENLKLNSAVRISNCIPGSENAISYVSHDAIDRIVFKWKVPSNFSGQVYFRATFAESFSKFWENVVSKPIQISV